jgi:dihydroorotate dehydrogenase (fumarate)
MAHVSERLVNAGARGLVMFNRFYQPDFDIETETIKPSLDLSIPAELRLRLRWVAMLYGHLKTDFAITGGVHSGTDVVKSLMAGANVAMMASALLKHGVDYVGTVVKELDAWLDSHNYPASDAIRGKLSHIQTGDSAALERANYLNVLLSQRSKTNP